jgi:hypothetical protein
MILFFNFKPFLFSFYKEKSRFFNEAKKDLLFPALRISKSVILLFLIFYEEKAKIMCLNFYLY